MTTVVNLKNEPYDVYIGRDRNNPKKHFGNPFPVQGIGREKSILNFKQWLYGEAFLTVEPERREWILKNMEVLRGKRLGCFCKPLACHGDVYVKFLNSGV